MDEGECKKAVEFLGRTYRGKEFNRRNPSGCYVYPRFGRGYFDRSGYFNKHESGTGSVNTKSICKQGVYQFIHNQSSSNIHHFNWFVSVNEMLRLITFTYFRRGSGR